MKRIHPCCLLRTISSFSALDVEPMDEATVRLRGSSRRWGFSALDVEPMDEARGGDQGDPQWVKRFSALDVEPMDEAAEESAEWWRWYKFQCS